MRRAIVLAALLMVSCASWQSTANKTIYYTHEAVKTARSIIQPAYQSLCVQAAEVCKAENVAEVNCIQADRCLAQARTASAILKATTYAAADAQVVVAIGDEDSAEGVLAHLAKLLADIRQQIAILSEGF